MIKHRSSDSVVGFENQMKRERQPTKQFYFGCLKILATDDRYRNDASWSRFASIERKDKTRIEKVHVACWMRDGHDS